MTKDMTQGSPIRLILKFTIPLIFGNLFQQFYSMVDTIIVGRYLGNESLAAVGCTGSINFLIIGFCVGLCSGFAIPVSQQFGAKDFQSLHRYVGNIVWLTAGLSAVFTLLTVILCMPMLEWTNTPQDIILEAYWCIVIIFAGIPAIFLYNILASLLRALGDSRTPVIFLIMASFLNIGFDFLLVVIIPIGVAGAAIATVLAQLLSGVACLIYIAKKFPLLHITRDDLKIRKDYISRLCSVGLPMGLQISITGLGSILLQAAVNSLGSMIVAAVTAAGCLYGLFCCVFDAMGIAMSPYVGQNIGARKSERLAPGVKAGMILAGIYSIISMVLIYFFGKPMLMLFVDASESSILNDAYLFMLINGAFSLALSCIYIIRLFIQGMGYSKMAMFAGVCEMAARSIAGLWLVPQFGYIAACFASPIAWIMADLFLIPAYFYIMRQLKRWGTG